MKDHLEVRDVVATYGATTKAKFSNVAVFSTESVALCEGPCTACQSRNGFEPYRH